MLFRPYVYVFQVKIVDLVIFVCLTFCEFLIWGLFVKFRMREFLFSIILFSIIIIIFVRFLNSRICPPREISKNSDLANITGSTICDYSE